MSAETLASRAVAEAVQELCPDAPPRAWSLIVTVFGDTGGEIEITAAPLARILALTGVSGAALRVALHRLKADGWITARRVGRSSAYRLHPNRLSETRAASARIYATAAPDPDAWHVLVEPPDAPATTPDRGEALRIGPTLLLRAGTPEAGDGLLLRPVRPVPGWLRDTLGSAELRAAYDGLLSGLTKVDHLTRDRSLDPAEAIALRILVVHAWRRVILRHPALPDALFPDDWPAAACRAQVLRLLARFPRPDAAQLAAL